MAERGGYDGRRGEGRMPVEDSVIGVERLIFGTTENTEFTEGIGATGVALSQVRLLRYFSSVVPNAGWGGVNLESDFAPEIESALCKRLFSYWLSRLAAA